MAATTPPGWTRPGLELHLRWHARRALTLRARLALAVLVPLVVAVWLGAPVGLLAVALVGLVLPIAPPRASTLRQIERAHGEAYTTALVAPPGDRFGLGDRLRFQAETVQNRAVLPGGPLIEALGALALASLLLVLPARGPVPPAGGEARLVAAVPARERQLPGVGLAEPVLDAESSGLAPGGGAGSRPGRAASGGTPAEDKVGSVRPGAGDAREDPDAVTREFLEALERGAVRGRPAGDEQAANPDAPAVEDRDALAAGRGAQGGGGDAKGSNGSGAGQEPGGAQRPGAQPGGRDRPDAGSQGAAGNGQDGSSPDGPQKPSGISPGNGQDARDGGRSRDGNQNDSSGGLDDGGAGSGAGGEGAGGQDGATGPGGATGARGAGQGGERDPGQLEGTGALEYLPGDSRGQASRAGALQLPGDPRRPLTGNPASAEYRRAVEAAVLDPRLPPEYQELLRSYYR